MNIVCLILSVLALVVSIIGLIKTSRKEVIKEVVKDPQTTTKVDNPFTYDEQLDVYVLDGNLEVTGAVGALGKEDKV